MEPWVLGSPLGRVWGFAGSPPGRDLGIGAPHAGPAALLGAPCAEIGALEHPEQDLGLFWSPPCRAGDFAGVRHAGSGQHGCGHPHKSARIPLLGCDPLLPPPGLFFFVPSLAAFSGESLSPSSHGHAPAATCEQGKVSPGFTQFSAVGASSGCDPCRPAA